MKVAKILSPFLKQLKSFYDICLYCGIVGLDTKHPVQANWARTRHVAIVLSVKQETVW